MTGNPSNIWTQLAAPNPAAGGVPFVTVDNITVVIDVLNFYYNPNTPGRLSVNTNGDYTGSDAINTYYQQDSYVSAAAMAGIATPQTSALVPGHTTSSSQGTGSSPLASLAGDPLGVFSHWGAVGAGVATYTPFAGMYGKAAGVTTGNLGGELHLATKADGGVYTDRLVIDDAGVVTIAGNLTVGGNFTYGGTLTISGTLNVGILNATTSINAPIATLGSATLSGTLTVTSDITAGQYNNVTITAPASNATLTILNGKTFSVNNTLTFAGTDATTFTFPAGTDTVVGLAAVQTLTNKTLTNPVMTTPTLGVAAGTTFNKVTITPPAASATLTIANTKTLTASNTLTFTGTDGSTFNLGGGNGQIPGIAAATAAAAGNVGEEISSTVLSGSAVPCTTTISRDITSIVLTAGRWLVWGTVWAQPAAGTTITAINAWTNSVAATPPNNPNGGGQLILNTTFAASALNAVSAGMQVVALAGATTMSLGCNISFGVSTLTAYGFIGAVRLS